MICLVRRECLWACVIVASPVRSDSYRVYSIWIIITFYGVFIFAVNTWIYCFANKQILVADEREERRKEENSKPNKTSETVTVQLARLSNVLLAVASFLFRFGEKQTLNEKIKQENLHDMQIVAVRTKTDADLDSRGRNLFANMELHGILWGTRLFYCFSVRIAKSLKSSVRGRRESEICIDNWWRRTAINNRC